MKVRWLLVGSLALGTGLSSGTTTAQRLSVLDLLDRYGGGQFEAVVEVLNGDIDFGDLLKQVRRDGPVWIDAAGSADRARREIVAVTFALEAARAGEWREWKLTQMQPQMCSGSGRVRAADERAVLEGAAAA